MNCSQIFCTFAVETTSFFKVRSPKCCELLSNFLYFCSRNNERQSIVDSQQLWIALKFFVLLQSKQRKKLISVIAIRCELLSNFLYFCSRNNRLVLTTILFIVVNCSQIFCTFAVETTDVLNIWRKRGLWIALKFFVLLQSKQQ